MPTVILLDVSLSMTRPVPSSDTSENHTRLTIATAAINAFLDYLTAHAKLEYVALVCFSSYFEVAVPFTRDFDSIKSKLTQLEEGDKTCIETALLGVNQLILNEWGSQTPVQIILVTDGSCGTGAIGRNRIIQALPLPPSYPAKIHVLPVVSAADTCLQHAMPLYQKIVDLAVNAATNSNGTLSRGAIYCPDQLNVPAVPLTPGVTTATFADDAAILASHKDAAQASALLQTGLDAVHKWLQKWKIKASTSKSVQVTFTLRNGNCPPVKLGETTLPHDDCVRYVFLARMCCLHVIASMTRLCEQHYQEFWCSLKCGQLEARVQLFPAPQTIAHEGLATPHTLTHQLHVVGFISQQELGTPIALSKHLVIPQAQAGANNANRENYGSKTPTKEGSSTDSSATEEDMSDPSKVPNFCVLLHGALKVESMSAIVQLGADWWGTLSAWCEASRARRSCLLLSVLRPGVTAAPWLGQLDQLGPVDDGGSTESFPVRSWRSYSSGGAGCAWARPHALLADVQKVLRHARKLPDKTQHLYKELNRLRRAAISLGFSELLTCVGTALERECASLPSSAPPECALQLAHAAAALRDPRTALDIKHTLQPLAANFTVTSMSH